MFANACEKASKYTFPMIISYRTVNGRTVSSYNAFIVVNRDGWAITAGHVFGSFIRFREDQKKIEEHKKRKEEDPGFDEPMDPGWMTNHSVWFGWNDVRLGQVYVNHDIDLALVKLENFRPELVREYPIFKDPQKLRKGTSLCRIGYPFIEDTTEFDKASGTFRIKPGLDKMDLFPLDGIMTKEIKLGKSSDGFDKTYIETTSPGLKGQSGGPLFDVNGYVAGMQSRTLHLDLGFPAVGKDKDGNEFDVKQYLHVGWSVHVSTLMQIFDEKGVKYSKETDDQGFRILG